MLSSIEYVSISGRHIIPSTSTTTITTILYTHSEMPARVKWGGHNSQPIQVETNSFEIIGLPNKPYYQYQYAFSLCQKPLDGGPLSPSSCKLPAFLMLSRFIVKLTTVQFQSNQTSCITKWPVCLKVWCHHTSQVSV
jgi:hypothetical protein